MEWSRWDNSLIRAIIAPAGAFISMVRISNRNVYYKSIRSQNARMNVTQDDDYVNLEVLPDPLSSSATFQHTQSAASSMWTVNHNLGFPPNVRAYSSGGREMIAEVIHNGLNQSLIYFDSPANGFAVCS